MGPFEMVLGIVLIVTIAGIAKEFFKFRAKRSAALLDDPEAARLRDEVRVLRERVQVLERIATDRNHALEHEFERLRDQ